jgi:hypothetical protein
MTDFDAICLGLYVEKEMELEQELHMEGSVLCCSPDNGHFTVKSPVVNFNLEVIEGGKSQKFKIKLLNN